MNVPRCEKRAGGSAQQCAWMLTTGICLTVMLILTACGEDPTQNNPVQPIPDTTSHDFAWDWTLINDYDNGVLRDICYINDTCIWAVGWIVQHGPNNERLLYNAVHWNGKEWKLESVPYRTQSGSTLPFRVSEMMTVYGDRPDNIWFNVAGVVFVHWDGKYFQTDLSTIDQQKGAVTECWGGGSNNIWMGGGNGELLHYNGKMWKRIENQMPPEYDIEGICGHQDTVMLAATTLDTGPTILYRIVNESVEFWRTDSLPRGVQAVWMESMCNIWTDGQASFMWDGYRWLNMHILYAGYGLDMAANNKNDILICGDVCTVRHWNGINWRSWWKWPGIESARFRGVAIHKDEAWVVGKLASGGDLIIMHGKR
jgi:hypothetical protein